MKALLARKAHQAAHVRPGVHFDGEVGTLLAEVDQVQVALVLLAQHSQLHRVGNWIDRAHRGGEKDVAQHQSYGHILDASARIDEMGRHGEPEVRSLATAVRLPSNMFAYIKNDKWKFY